MNTTVINKNDRFNTVCGMLQNSTPSVIKSLVFELMDLTFDLMVDNPSPALCNRAVDSTKGLSYNKYIRAYLLEFAPFAYNEESKKFEGKLNKKKHNKKIPTFSLWYDATREEEKNNKKQKPKADNKEKIIALWAEIEESEKISILEKLTKEIDKEKMLDILNSI